MVRDLKVGIALAGIVAALPLTSAFASSHDIPIHTDFSSEFNLNHSRPDSLNARYPELLRQQEQRLQQIQQQPGSTQRDLQEPVQLRQLKDPAASARLQARVAKCEEAVAAASGRLNAGPAAPSPTPASGDDPAVSPVLTEVCPAPAADTLPSRKPLRYNIRKWWSRALVALTVRDRTRLELLRERASSLRCNVVNCTRIGDRACADQALTDLESTVEKHLQTAGTDDFAACALDFSFTLIEPASGGPSPTPTPGSVLNPLTGPTNFLGSDEISDQPNTDSAAPGSNYQGGVLMDLFGFGSTGLLTTPVPPSPTPDP